MMPLSFGIIEDNMENKRKIEEDILNVLHWHATNQRKQYVNPHFLMEILESLQTHCNVDSKTISEVERYVDDMYNI